MIGSTVNSAHVTHDMEAIEGSYRTCAGKTSAAEDVAHNTRNLRMDDKHLEKVWTLFSTELVGFCLTDNLVHQKVGLVTGLSSCSPTRLSEPPSYDQPPPSYNDVIDDLPPEYSALPPLAHRKSTTLSFAPKSRQTLQKSLSSLLEDRILDSGIDFENFTGIREHKKKKPVAKKAAPPPSPPPPPPPPEGGANGGDDNSTGDGGAGGDSNGAGSGDGGDGGDDWGTWNWSGKKDKKKKAEEEEEEKKAKEEEERKAREEEERQAKEEKERKAAEDSAAKDLSWSEDDGGGWGQ